MKVKTIVFVLVIMGLSACTQKFCPTYASNDTPDTGIVVAENA